MADDAAQREAQQQRQKNATDAFRKELSALLLLGPRARVRKWYQLLQLFKKQTDSIEFVYLKNADPPTSVRFHPYNLDVVPHAAVKGANNYFTLSRQGVTHFWDGHAEFCSLEQFEREYFLHTQMMRLRIFRHFRSWKAWRVWRRGVYARKAAHAREVLGKASFALHPVFGVALLRVRAACGTVAALRLHGLGALAGRTMGASLEEWTTAQAAQADTAARTLAEFFRSTVATAREACFRAIELLEHELIESKEKSNQAKKAAAAGAATVRLAVTKAAQMANEAEFSYAINAARRSEKRRVHSFVRLLDYIICSALHELLLGSVADMHTALTPPPPPPSPRAALRPFVRHSGLTPEVDPPPPPARPPALLRLDILLEMSEGGETGCSATLVFSPEPSAFFDQLSRSAAKWAEQAKGLVGRLLLNERLQEIMEKPLDGGDVDVEGFNIIIVDEGHEARTLALQDLLAAAFLEAEAFRDTLTHHRDWFVANAAVSEASLRAEVVAGKRTLDKFRQDWERWNMQLAEIDKIPAVHHLGVLEIHLDQLVAVLRPSPTACLQHVRTLLPQLAAETHQAFISKVHGATSRLLKVPTSVDEFADHLKFFAETERAKSTTLDKEYDKVVAHYDLIEECDIVVPDIQLAAYHTLEADYTSLRDAMWQADSNRDALVIQFKGDLDIQVDALNREVTDIRLLSQHDMILDERSNPAEVLAYTEGLVDQVATQLEAAERIRGYQRQFRLGEAAFEGLEELAEEVRLRHALWASRGQWAATTAEWLSLPLAEVSEPTLEEAVARMTKLSFGLDRGLPPNKVVGQLKDAVAVWRDLLPVVRHLRNPDLRDRHWTKVNAALGGGVDLQREEGLTLEALLSLDVVAVKDVIAAISTEANQEAALESMLDKIHDRWRQVEFTVIPYKDSKDVFILGAVDEVVAVLEDSLVVVATISASRFVTGIKGEVAKMDRQLRLFSDTLDEWLECQKQWLYLETIFSAADIQRQLPTEAKLFAHVDKQFKDVMRRTRERPNAMLAATIPGLLDVLTKCNQALEQVQKNLEDYLETKRVSFPRFYFLSNDELLEILSQTRNVRAVQPHLQKCFDGIRMLDFGDDPKSIDILAMISGEGERVPLGKNLKARGNVETWLTAVEASMRTSLRNAAKRGFREYSTTPRTEWVLQNPAQLVIAVSNVYWCQAVEACLAAPVRDPAPALGTADPSPTPDPGQRLRALFSQCASDLTALTGLVRGQLSDLQRKVMVALITIDVHNRDIVEALADGGVNNAADFGWQMQLRYAYDAEEEQVTVAQVNARFNYCYEYLGAQPRLVVTPMTDRCYMTLTGALHMKLGGAPAGPAGTGKTETTKDLGKALGVHCVVFNCGENLDHKFMGKFFSGLAQCGAWACFDEFNRIDIEVLSVVAQQLLVIQNALKAGLERFLFEGREMRLLPTCGVFITMNPGYAGRTELPDNLKALFRPMAMMIPDYALVAEVMLYSEGFSDARNLSRKMVKLYKLASEQLSQQDHYDFGMRALKSVLVMAGSLKRADPDLLEDIVLIRAMRDSNIPKFLNEDARLFNAIVSDLFPGVKIPVSDSGALSHAAAEAAIAAGLQPHPEFVTKVTQLFETFNVRFGVMLVGPTGGGKTACYRVLATAMTRLRAEGHADPAFQSVRTWVLNPKAVKMGELFGEYNLLTNEWADGLASSLIRTAAADTRLDRHWVVFDGPVDAAWVENMNTVLDDNCTLCLPNGERIKLNPVAMRMLFEVQDLAVASPATVSRCGMVYVPPESLGWRPYVKSWLARLAQLHTNCDACAVYPPASGAVGATADEAAGPDSAAAAGMSSGVAGSTPLYLKQNLDFINDMLASRVDTLLAGLRAECRTSLPASDLNLVTSTVMIFTALTHPSKGAPNLAAPLEEPAKVALHYIFAFSCTWGMGGALDSGCWDKWDKVVRGVFDGTANYPGGATTVFDYYLDKWKNFGFGHFSDHVPKFKYSPTLPYFQILVPTIDTVRYSFLLRCCLEVRRSVLVTGASGVGKSAVALDTLAAMAPTHDLLPVALNFSAQTSSQATQGMIEAKLEKKRKRRFGAPAGKHIVLFVDDVNMPAREMYGAQPPLELLRQLLDFSGFYDRKKLFWKEIEGMTLCAAGGPPGGGRQEVSPRFLRHFTLLSLPPPSEACMATIFSSILGGFLDAYFTPDVRMHMMKPIVDSSIQVYMRIAAELLPTPAKSHYTFNLRDVSKVFQGLLSIRPAQCGDLRATLARLWTHETMRVFHDRLTCTEDKEYFMRMLYELLKGRFEVKGDYESLFETRPIIFGDFMKLGVSREDRAYEEITDHGRLLSVLTSYLDDFNASHNAPLGLVFFQDAVQHITRIARILRQPRGSAMLVGVGGSGKQALTRFAAHISDTQCFSIELTRSYGLTEFREDIKKLFRMTGVDGYHVAFLFTDNHIVNEGFVEDINNLLNSGEITGLYSTDERERIFADVRSWAAYHGGNGDESRDAVWRIFIGRVRDHLHLVLAMSPVGEAFRARCRQFPSLINCCTIDWFSAWPGDALLSVATRALEPLDLGGKEVNPKVAGMCVEIHTSVLTMADRFFLELRRRYYVTPKSYLDLLALYTKLLAARREDMSNARGRLLNGLSKLQETNVVVDSMQKELAALQPVLVEKTKTTQQLLVQVEAEGRDAEAMQRVVAIEEEEVKTKQAETQVLKNDAQKDLEEVLPALDAAEKALNALNKTDIVEIKTFTKPPLLVQLTMEGICMLLQEKPDWETAKRLLGDSSFIRRLVEYDKDHVPDKVVRSLKRLIDDPTFTPDQVAKTSKAAMSMCLWVRAMDTYAKVAKVVEPKREVLRAAQAALEQMNEALAAKTEQLMQLQAKVDALQDQLEATQGELLQLQMAAEVSSKRLERASKLISALGDESIRWQATADELGDRMLLLVGDVFISAACISYTGAFTGVYRAELTGQWVSRCRQLAIPASPTFTLQNTVASAVEVREWNLQGLPTDALSVDNGILVTRGSRWPLMIDPQDQANRWVKAMESRNGLRSLRAADSNILRTLENCIRLGSPVLLEDVGEALDPALDPLLQKQMFSQGTRTLIRLGDTDVDYDPSFRFYMTTKLPNPHYLPEVCIKVNLINFTVTIKGLEDQLLGEVVRRERPELEEARDRLVLSISNDKRQLADLEDKVLKLLRESQGNILDDEVLINTLNTSNATSATIAARVREAEETERAINAAREVYRPVPIRASVLYFVVADLAGVDPMYQHSLAYFTALFNRCIDAAARSDDLRTRLVALMATTTEVVYRMVCRGLFEAHKSIFSILIVTAIQRQAGQIPPEEWNVLLRGAPPPKTLSPQPATLPWLTDAQWVGLQALDAAVPAFKGSLTSSFITQPELWKRFMDAAEPHTLDMAPYAEAMGLPPPPAPGSLEDEPPPGHVPVPDYGHCALNAMLALLPVKVLREDRLAAALQRYTARALGPQFVEPPTASLPEVFQDSGPTSPIIFILSQGADPASGLTRFAQSMGRALGERLHVISLGQGQGPIAESSISMSLKSGDWVCLQNCHLARSWMPRLERLVEDIVDRYAKQQQFAAVAAADGPGAARPESGVLRTRPSKAPDTQAHAAAGSETYDVHPDFRLWLTSMPSPHFPVPVLQNGIKVTQEPPKGLRANLLRAYNQLPDGALDLPVDHPHAANWRRLVYLLATFHALLQERRKFGPLGWNIPYEFSAGDFDCALLTLGMFLGVAQKGVDSATTTSGGPARAMSPSVPWQALTYVTGQINYGGRVTDDNDRRLLMCILNRYYRPEVLADGYAFTPSGTYRSPAPGDVSRYQAHIRSLPAADDPELFGLHPNAAITLNLQESRKVLDVVLSIQPRTTSVGPGTTGGAAAHSPEAALLDVVSTIQARLPPELLKASASVVRSPFAPLPSGHDNSLGTVLAQEMERFNGLRRVLSHSCEEVSRAVRGLAVMSSELEAMTTSLANNQVPALWARVAYPSLKPLGAWVADFGRRMAFMEAWLTDGQPPAFWLPGFFFPQGFLTAVLQNHARNTRVPIDRLGFTFQVLPALQDVAAIKAPPPDGVLVHGLFLDSAVWDQGSATLGIAAPRQMTSVLPPVQFKPAVDVAPRPEDYQCPLYKTSVRAGVLSTTGMSTNFVLYLSLPVPHGSHPDEWVMQGVAALCALDE